MTKTFKIITLGCKVNQYESAYLTSALIKSGWSQGKGSAQSDLTIVNTCIVTQSAAHQSRQALRKAIRENPQGITAAVGCYAQVYGEELSKIDGIDLILGNTVKYQLPLLLEDMKKEPEKTVMISDFEADMHFSVLPLEGFTNRTRAFLKIQDGCQSFCSYCIVPFARGPYRSLKPPKVLQMLENFSAKGHKEVVLTGIHLGKYGIDLKGGTNLNKLLDTIGREGYPLRIRLSSLEPNEIDKGLIQKVAEEAWICRHFHIPLQSGDNRIIQRMNRRYTAEEFSRLVGDIYDNIPCVSIGVDVMCGFPGEDEKAYQNSFSLIRDLPVSYLHVFPFSPRPGTKAARFEKHLYPREVKKRCAEIRNLGQAKKSAFYNRCLQKEFMVLSERWQSKTNESMKGMTDNYIPVVFHQAQGKENEFVLVRLEQFYENMVTGSAVIHSR